MSDSKYKLLWKEGSLFEKGHWKLVPDNSGSGSALMFYLIGIIVLVIIGSTFLLTLPLWFSLLGFQMIREKRYLAGIFAALGLLYFFIDLDKEWISSLLFYGWNSDDGEINNGIFGLTNLVYFKIVNYLGFGLGLGFIIDCVLVSQYGKMFNDNRITMPQVVSYLSPVVLIFIWILLNNDLKPFNIKSTTTFKEESIKNEKPKNGLYEEKFKDGKLRISGQFKNGKRNGEWIEWQSFRSNYGRQIKETKTYKDGVLEGEYKSFWFEGSLEYSGEYVNGKKHGKWELNYPPNQLCELRYYDNGKPCGTWKQWQISHDVLTGKVDETVYGSCSYISNPVRVDETTSISNAENKNFDKKVDTKIEKVNVERIEEEEMEDSNFIESFPDSLNKLEENNNSEKINTERSFAFSELWGSRYQFNERLKSDYYDNLHMVMIVKYIGSFEDFGRKYYLFENEDGIKIDFEGGGRNFDRHTQSTMSLEYYAINWSFKEGKPYINRIFVATGKFKKIQYEMGLKEVTNLFIKRFRTYLHDDGFHISYSPDGFNFLYKNKETLVSRFGFSEEFGVEYLVIKVNDVKSETTTIRKIKTKKSDDMIRNWYGYEYDYYITSNVDSASVFVTYELPRGIEVAKEYRILYRH